MQGSHIYWKTWKNIVHLEKSWNFAKNNKNRGNIMEFCQSGNVGTLGYCGNDIFLIRWNFYVNIDPKVIGGHIKNIQKIYLEFFFEKPGNIMEFCQSGNVGTLQMSKSQHCEPWQRQNLTLHANRFWLRHKYLSHLLNSCRVWRCWGGCWMFDEVNGGCWMFEEVNGGCWMFEEVNGGCWMFEEVNGGCWLL